MKERTFKGLAFKPINLLSLIVLLACNSPSSSNKGQNLGKEGQDSNELTQRQNIASLSGSDSNKARESESVVENSLVEDIFDGEDIDTTREELNIKRFGALGNGVADDSPALLNAIRFIKNNPNIKYTLIFPKGEYPLSVEVKVDNLVFTGEGSIIPVSGKVEYALVLIGDGNVVEGLDFIEKAFARSLLIVDGNHNSIIRCKFDGLNRPKSEKVIYSDRMLYIRRRDGKGNVIKQCSLNNGKIGIGLAGSYKLLDSEISNCIMGVWATPSTRNSEIARNVIHDNNVIQKSGADGILAQRNVSKLHIHHNKIYNSGEHGIYFQGDNSIIENNEIFQNHGSGIKLASYTTLLYNNSKPTSYIGRDNIVRNNICYNNSVGDGSSSGAGIYLQAPLQNITVVNNTCYGNRFGIRSTSVAKLKAEELNDRAKLVDIRFSDNKLVDNEGYSLFVEGEKGIIIENNELDDLMTTSKSKEHRLIAPVIRKNNIRGTLFINRAEGSVIEDNTINKLNVNNNSLHSKQDIRTNRITSSNIKE